MFQGTLRENIDPKHENSEDKTSEDFKFQDSKIVDLLDQMNFSNKKYRENGLDMIVGTGSDGLSAGEAQIIAFVREMLYPKKIAIFDEATSNLDTEIESIY